MQNNRRNNSELLHQHEAAAVLRCSASKIRKLLFRGELGYIRIDSRRLIPRSAINEYLASRTIKAQPPRRGHHE